MQRSHNSAKSKSPARVTPSASEARREDACWDIVTSRDTSKDGAFYFSVATTGIYCRPGCPARTPKRENVTFYATADEAEAAGFRACKRCKPREAGLREAHRGIVAEACRAIETSAESLSLTDLARAAGLSPHHFHRLFKSIVGVTPKAYAVAHRQKRVRDTSKRSKSVTDAIYESGFNSNGRFYADSTKVLGMTPTDYRDGGAKAVIRYTVADCSLGKVLVAASATGVCAIYLGEDADALSAELSERFPKAVLSTGDAKFDALTKKVVRAVDAPENGWDLPLDIRGTAFQHRVWQALRDIPPGETRTYAQIAEAIGSPKAVRAVGTACGANEISVAIPCHRVVRRDGSFPNANYRWGVDRKRQLLDREASAKGKSKTRGS